MGAKIATSSRPALLLAAGYAPAYPETPLEAEELLGGQELAFFSTIATFGTARDVTVAELSIESYFPADKSTSAALHTTFS